MITETQKIVSPELYTEEYYLTDNDGYKEFKLGLDTHTHHKFARALENVPLRPGMRVLDIGCGRGELSYYAASRGCYVTAVDYSEAAVQITQMTLRHCNT